jgi:hypothetical protein
MYLRQNTERTMRRKEQRMKVGILLILVWLGICWAVYGSAERITMKYDCALAEISPDIPQSVKEQCRKLQEGKK